MKKRSSVKERKKTRKKRSLVKERKIYTRGGTKNTESQVLKKYKKICLSEVCTPVTSVDPREPLRKNLAVKKKFKKCVKRKREKIKELTKEYPKEMKEIKKKEVSFKKEFKKLEDNVSKCRENCWKQYRNKNYTQTKKQRLCSVCYTKCNKKYNITTFIKKNKQSYDIMRAHK